MLKKKVLGFMSIIGVVMIAGCSSSGAEVSIEDLEEARYEIDPNTPAWQVDDEENVELTWYVNAEWFDRGFGEDVITKKLKEDLNLDITFVTGDDSNLNTLFSGGDLPDLITIFDGQSQAALRAPTWALPLRELADQYDPYFHQVAQEQTLDWYQLEDGFTYGYPSYSNTIDDYQADIIPGSDAFIIREDIYEALGEPDLSTPEQFINSLQQMKEAFPDVVPFAFRGFGSDGDVGSIGDTFQNHLGVPIADENSDWYNRNLDDSYLEWIRTFNEAYQLGLISDDNFSDDNTVFEEKVERGQYGSVFASGIAQLSGSLQTNVARDPDQRYIAVDGPKNSNGNEPTLNQAGLSGWTVTYITNKVSDPQKAIQLFTYLLSDEGQYLTTFGVEGETFDFNENGKAVLHEDVLQMRNDNPEEYKKSYRLGEFWFFGHDGFALEHGENEASVAVDQIQKWTKGKLKPQFLIENINPDQGTAEARSLVNIDSTWATTLASMIRAKDDREFDRLIDEYETFLETNNFAAVEAIRNEKMNENREKLGL